MMEARQTRRFPTATIMRTLKQLGLSQAERRVAKHILRFGLPVAAARIPVGATDLAGGFAAAAMDIPGISRALLTATLYRRVITGTTVALIFGLITEIGQLNGQQQYAQIGRTLRDGQALAASLGIIDMALIGSGGSFLEAVLDLERETAQQIHDYLWAYTPGVLFGLMLMADVQFSVATKHKNVPLGIRTFQNVAGIAIGVPWALQDNQISRLTAGISISTATAAVMLRGYFAHRRNSFAQFEIFSLHRSNADYRTDLKQLGGGMYKLLEIAYPLMFQVMVDLMNLLIINGLVSAQSKDAASAMAPASLISSAYISIFTGFGQATKALAANKVGESRKALLEHHTDNAQARAREARAITNVSVKIFTQMTAVLSAVAILSRRPIVTSLLDQESRDDDSIVNQAEFMFVLSMLAIIADAMRSIASSNIQAFKDGDRSYPAKVGFGLVNVVALPIGALAAEYSGNANWHFVMRLLGLSGAAALILRRQIRKFAAFEQSPAAALRKQIGEDSLGDFELANRNSANNTSGNNGRTTITQGIPITHTVPGDYEPGWFSCCHNFFHHRRTPARTIRPEVRQDQGQSMSERCWSALSRCNPWG